ncbi:unnamed protein product, partial [Candidula unifasciata]
NMHTNASTCLLVKRNFLSWKTRAAGGEHWLLYCTSLHHYLMNDTCKSECI